MVPRVFTVDRLADLTNRELDEVCGTVTVARGLAYAKQGRVVELELSDDGTRATGWVGGSNGQTYTTNVSLEEAMEPDVMLVHTWEGRPLPREHGGPVRMITPQLYAWKGAKWIKQIHFAQEDCPGFWERRGYSNTAYPWYDDRYSRG